MNSFTGRIRAWLFGPSRKVTMPKLEATSMLRKITHGDLRELNDTELMELVLTILGNSKLRTPLRGNTRFLDDLVARHAASGRMSPKQRQAVLNILERAYPHNLAVELRNIG